MSVRVRHLLTVCGFFAALSAFAAEPPAPTENGIFIDQSRRLTFEPSDAFFLVSFDAGRVLRVPAMIVRLEGESSVRGDVAPVTYGAGARVRPPRGSSQVSFSTVFLGTANRLEFVPPTTLELSEASLNRSSTDTLREQLLQRKAVLGSWRMQAQAQEDSLNRLRADAEVIGDFGRILDKKEEIERAKNDLASVKKDIQNLDHFLKLAKTRPAPVNQVGREAQLVKQLSEITQVSHAVELTEIRRRASAETELQRKLALIEATRQDDLATLTSELERLRREAPPAEPPPGEEPSE